MTATTERSVKGILGEKLGMTQVWDAENRLVPVTVVKAGPCVVVQKKSSAGRDGYDVVSVTAGGTIRGKVTFAGTHNSMSAPLPLSLGRLTASS